MREYKGVGSDCVKIDGEKLFIKSFPIKNTCYLAHIEWIHLLPINFQGRGQLRIVTNDSFIWNTIYKRDQYDKMKEAYDFLLPYAQRMIVDQEKQEITILNKGGNNKLQKATNRVNDSNPYTYVKFEDISSYEVISDVPQIVNNNAFTNAAGGKYVAGDLGTLAGAISALGNGTFMSKLQIKLNLKSLDNPCTYIKYYTRKTEVNSPMGKFLTDMFQQDVAKLEEILRLTNPKEEPVAPVVKDEVPLEELKQLKELLDMGIITQDEFDTKKKQLLGI